MNVGVLDLETSKKPILHPWMKDAFLSTIGLQLWVDGKSSYKEWVWYHGERPDITEDDRLQIVFEVQEAIDSLGPDGLLAGHNIKFDANWMKWFNVDLTGVKWWCTAIADHMLAGQVKSRKYDLSTCCEGREIPVKTDVVKTYWDAGRNTDTIPLSTLLPYMKNDIDITAQLFKSQYRQMISQTNLFKLCRVRNDCLQSVSDIEINGMPFDRATAEGHVSKFQGEVDLMDSELKTIFGRSDINLRSGPELSACLFGGNLQREKYVPDLYSRNVTYKQPYLFTYKSGKMMGMTIRKYKNVTLREITCKRKKVEYEIPIQGIGFIPRDKTELKPPGCGIFQTNKNIIRMLTCNSKGGSTSATKRKVLDILRHRSKIAQFVQTFVGTKKDTGLFFLSDLTVDGWLHPNYNQTIASTGRFTSSGPNGQNFSRSKEDDDGFSNPLKQCFYASRLGGLILVIDLSQLEWRVAAWLSQDPVAMQEILNGIDCHLDNAIKFFGDAKFRQVAKIMTFRLLYGGSAYAFYMDPLMPSFSLKRWNEIERQYHQKYCVLQAWQQDNITKVGQNNGVLNSPTGRIYTIPMSEHKKFPGTMIYTETCIKNYPVQGTATGDIVPLAIDVMSKRMQLNARAYMSTNWMGSVHDSVIFDTMPHEVKRTAKLGIEVFEDLPEIINDLWGVNFNLPMTGEATAGVTYGDQTASVEHKDGRWITKGNWNELCRV